MKRSNAIVFGLSFVSLFFVVGCGDDDGMSPACMSGEQDNDGDGSCEAACGADTCSSRGSCDDSNGSATCTCAAGYSGSDCGECAQGFQDNDEDGSCVAACDDSLCADGGTCDDSSGSPECLCGFGFGGVRCDDCAEGFQDNDGDGFCTPRCSDQTCSGNGTCADDSGLVACDCDEAYDGQACSVCRAGYEADASGDCVPSCGAVFCSGNGTCDNGSGSTECTCAEGHAGDDCSSCAEGYQDNDGNGRCEPACDAETCSGNGGCDDASGRTRCDCEYGFGGVSCEVCAAGFQDDDGDGSCALECTDDFCSGHGTCSTAGGEPVCACEAGHTGSRCDGCLDDFQDRDGDGVCAPACASDTCASTGSCDDSSGAALCICLQGYAGSDCSECDAGYQDMDGDGVCTASCDADVCGAGTCADDTGEIVCGCPDGYRGDRCEYRRIAALELPSNANYRDDAAIPYSQDDRSTVTAFDRVGYYVQLDDDWVFVTFDRHTDDPQKLGLPVEAWFKQRVENTSVETSTALVNEASSSPHGNIEFWHHCYGNRPNGWDYEDEIQEWRPNCFGTMAVYESTNVVFAYNRFATGGGGVDEVGFGGTTDPAFSNNIDDFTLRLLEVYVREAQSCDDADCGVGSCDDATGAPICTCTASTTGANCASCAAGYNDDDHDGLCEAPCEGDACSRLDVSDRTTGTSTFSTAGGDVDLYVDNDTDGGGWVLIGRGREDWNFTERGVGDANTIADGLGTPSAFESTYLSTSIIDQLIGSSYTDATGIEIRIKRAASLDGSEYQEVRMTWPAWRDWTWQMGIRNFNADVTFQDSALGTGGSVNDDLGNIQLANNHLRMRLTAQNNQNGYDGFSYGTSIGGRNDPTSFLYEYAYANHAIAYAEVYIRLRCGEYITGPACDECISPYQDNDEDGVCTPGCKATTCAASEGCVDSSGTAVCLSSSGTSCAEILAADATAADGSYAIDPDGAGPLEAIGVGCDMTGGGWTILSFETFENRDTEGWSETTIDDSDCQDVYGRYLGRFGRDASPGKTYALVVPHTEARVQLDLIITDSWDNELMLLNIDSTEVYRQRYRHSDAAAHTCGDSRWNEHGEIPLSFEVAHTADTLSLEATSSLNEASTNESFGLDNISIAVR